MKRFTSLLLLLVMVATVSWGQDTDNLDVNKTYLIKNGQGYWMTSETYPTDDVTKAGKFKFYASSKKPKDTYEIKCVTTGKWVSYDLNTKNTVVVDYKYANVVSFAISASDQVSANNWSVEKVDGMGNLGQVYQIRPRYKYLSSSNYRLSTSYMNWYTGIKTGENPNGQYIIGETTYSVGVWEQGAKDDAGSAWILVDVDDAQNVQEARDEYYQWKNNNAVIDGVNPFGRYPIINPSALADAEKQLNNATDVISVYSAMQKCKELYGKQNGFTVGKYYRIYNTKYSKYVGIDGSTMKMQAKGEDANDPTLIWQYVQEGDKFYLKSAYCGLYPQKVQSYLSATEIGAKDESKSLTYSVPGESSDGSFPCALYVGGDKVWVDHYYNISGHTTSSASGTDTHYIEEVSAPSDAVCEAYYKKNNSGLVPRDVPAKIESITDGAQLIFRPTDIAQPQEINDAIDALTNPNSASDVHQVYAYCKNYTPNYKAMLSTYQTAINTNGALQSVNYTAKAEWGTIVLPVDFKKPEGLKLYTCASVTNSKLDLVEYNGNIEAKTPYIVSIEDATLIENKQVYQFMDYANNLASTSNVEGGLLTGVLNGSVYAPKGSYVLTKRISTGKLAFYYVEEDNIITVSQNKCYMTPTAASTRYAVLFFEDTETGIEEVTAADRNNDGTIYNMAGQRLNKMQKGLNIVGGRIVVK